MTTAILIACIAPALFYLGARAQITAAIHSRYPSWLVGFMNCAACAGAWYAMGVAAVALAFGWPIFGSTSWVLVPVVGLAAIWWVPVAVDLQESALQRLSAPSYEALPAVPPILSAPRNSLLALAATARAAAARAEVNEGGARHLMAVADVAESIASTT